MATFYNDKTGCPESCQEADGICSLEPKIVAIGGGTGLSTMLRGLKECTSNITAIVTVADDGGGSGWLRQDLGMLPPGDIRNCILALANTEPVMQRILNYRFEDGALTGQSFGNLFLAALNGIYDSFDEAVRHMGEVLAITGRVLPVTNANVHLVAEFENGTTVFGESKIYAHKKEHQCKITRVRLSPEHPPALTQALEAINGANMIVLGPGSLYTSIIPNLLVSGIAGAISRADALKIYVCNVMTQEGETEGYTAFDHVSELLAHSLPGLIDVCLVNDSKIPERLIKRYEIESAEPTYIDRKRFENAGIKLLQRPLFSETSEFARHDSLLLAAELMSAFIEIRNRPGSLGAADRRAHDRVTARLRAAIGD